METETYKVAKQILDKFGNESKKLIISTPQIVKSTPSLNTGPKGFQSGTTSLVYLGNRSTKSITLILKVLTTCV